MLDFSSTLKNNNKEKDLSITNSNFIDKSFSGSLISDTSPVYLFCTSKNGINSKNENGWTPIYRSIIANNLIALNELLNLGSDPNISNNLGETPLYLCVDIDNYDALIILLQYNADTNIAKRNGTTPLHLAAKKNKDNFMHALLRNKANPNLPNKLYSQTATHIAIINKINEEMLNIFHEYNADIYNIKDKYDKTPFDYAKELKDDEYVKLIIKIFGEKNDENNSKQGKTLNITKIPEVIQINNDKILNLPKNLHNSNFNLLPEKISINKNQEKEENKMEKEENEIGKEENKIEKEDNKIEKIDKIDNNNKEIINGKNNNSNENDNKSLKYGILSSGDALYSDRSISQENESSKSKKEDTITENKNNIFNNNNLTEFLPIKNNTVQNEIKNKKSLILSLKNNINIDTKMIDNSKDIIIINNENNDSSQINNIQKKNIFENNEEKNKNGVNESNEENKVKNESSTDREIIKNIISSTVKKIKVNTNTSEVSSLNNNSNYQNNN